MKSRSGVILIVVGSLLLAHNFDLLHFHWLRQWWPAGLILLGLWSILSPQVFENDDASDRTRRQSGDGGPPRAGGA